MISVNSSDTAVAMAHVFAQADIGDGDQLRTFCFDRPQRSLNNSIFCVSARGLFVFLFRNAEEQDSLQSEVLSGARLIGNLFYRQLENPGHACDRPALIDFLADKQRQNKIVCIQLCLADEISQSMGTPQAARTMHQSSHKSRLRAGKSVASAYATNAAHRTDTRDANEA